MWFYTILLLLLVVVVAAVDQRKALSAPRRVTAKVISPHSVEVNWRDPDIRSRGGAKGTRLYVVRYKNSGQSVNSTDVFETVRSRSRRVKLFRMLPNTTYDISVKAVKKGKFSPWSKTIQVTTTGHEDKIYMVRNLTAIPVATDAILLSWLPPEQANKVVAYTIITQPTNGNGRQRKDVANNEMLEYKVGNLRPHILYSFRVQTMQKLSPHPLSQAVLAQPFSDVPSGSPKDITLQVIDSSHITVTWQPPSPHLRNGPILGYTLQYKHTGFKGGVVTTITTEKDIREYSLTEVLVNETYSFQIAASTVNGTGPYSKWETVFVEQSSNTESTENGHIHYGTTQTSTSGHRSDLVPLPPSEVKVVNRTGSSVFLAWSVPVTTPCCPVVAYKILITNYNYSSEHEMVRGTTHVHLTGLTSNILYGVSVTSISVTSESRPSHEVLFTTVKAVPPTILFFQTTTAYLGGDVNLTCLVREYELPKIDWFMSVVVGVDASDDDVIQVQESNSTIADTIKILRNEETQDSLISSMLMYNITRIAERKYFCLVRHSLGSEKRRHYLVVNERPRIVTSLGASVHIGATAKLVCEVSGKPLPDIGWVHSTSGAVYNETLKDVKGLVYVTSTLVNSTYIRQSHFIFKNSSIQDNGFYKCLAQSKAGKAEAQVELIVTKPPPGPVHKIQTIPLSPSRVSVSWLPPLNYAYNIAYYQIRYRKKAGGHHLVFNTTRVGSELYDLDHSTEYLVGVTAGTDDSLGESGPEVEVMTLTNNGLQPGNVTVKSLNTSIIQLDWEAPNSVSQMYIRGYNVFSRREREDRTEKLFVRGSNSKQFLIGLGRDDTYFLKISTVMTWGYEAHSPWIKIQKRSEGSIYSSWQTTFVTANARLSEVTLSWEPPSVDHSGLQPMNAKLKGYKIVYGPLNDPLNVSRVTLEGDKRTHVLTGLEPSTKYIISIRAFNDIGDGEPVYTRTITQGEGSSSSVATAYPPSKVENARASPVSSTEIHVQWEPPKRGQVTRYHIRYWRPGRKDKQSAWLTGTNQNYVAGSLKKNSNYRFEIIPYSGDFLGEGIVIFSNTYGDKPDGPPTNVSVQPLNATALIVTWDPPDPEKTNGQITGYKLVLRTKGGTRMSSFILPGTAVNYTLLNIQVSWTNKLRMAAMTINGTGVYSPWIECSLSSTFEKPGPPQNLSVTEAETSLTLQWKPPQFTGSSVDGYIVGYGRFIPELFRQILNVSQTTCIIKSLKPDTEYITSVRAFNYIGESSPAVTIARTSPVLPLATPLLAPVKLLARSESPTSLMLTWVDQVVSDNQKILDGRSYVIRFSPLSGETYSYISTVHHQHQLSDLEPATKYEISVKVVRGGNSSTWSLPVVNSTQQIAPNKAPENITASKLDQNPSIISLKWSGPSSKYGKIEEYIIYLTSEPSLDTKLWIVLRTDKREVKVKDIIPHTAYYFKLQARNKAGYGPLSETVAYLPRTDLRAAPTNLTVTGFYRNMSTTVKVAWSSPEVSLGQITGYMVYYMDTTQDDSAHWMIHTERGLDTVIVGLENNMTYIFKVQARYSTVYGPFSKTVSYNTAPHEIEPPSSVDFKPENNLNHSRIFKDDSSDDKDSSAVVDNSNDNYSNVVITASTNPNSSPSQAMMITSNENSTVQTDNTLDVIDRIVTVNVTENFSDINNNTNTIDDDIGEDNETNNSNTTVEYDDDDDDYEESDIDKENDAETVIKNSDVDNNENVDKKDSDHDFHYIQHQNYASNSEYENNTTESSAISYDDDDDDDVDVDEYSDEDVDNYEKSTTNVVYDYFDTVNYPNNITYSNKGYDNKFDDTRSDIVNDDILDTHTETSAYTPGDIREISTDRNEHSVFEKTQKSRNEISKENSDKNIIDKNTNNEMSNSSTVANVMKTSQEVNQDTHST